jgi:hypothetical protein
MTQGALRTVRLAVLLAAVSCLTLLGYTTGSGSRAQAERIAESAGRKCPEKPREVPANRNSAAAQILVPPRGARRLLLCRYGEPIDVDRGALGGSVLITRKARVRGLARKLNSLKAVPSGTYSCPADNGSVVVASFRYLTAPADPVFVQLSGCRWVSNGQLPTTYSATTGLLRTLLAATR